MVITRRALFAAPLLAAPAPVPPPAPEAALRPGTRSGLTFTPLPHERLAFHAAGLAPAIALPAPRARLAGLLPLAGRQVAMLAFAADPSAASRLDLMALVGWDGARLRVLALEVLRWQAPDGAALDTRVRASSDRMRVELRRDAGAPRGGRPWLRESWIDLLAWQEGGPLRDAPRRAPVPGTFQSRLAAARARLAIRLALPCEDIGEDVLALIAPADLP